MSDLKEIIKKALAVIEYRHGDVDTEDGTFATTDTDAIIGLEMSLAELFNDNGDDATFSECWRNVEKFCDDIESQAATIKQLEADKKKLQSKVITLKFAKSVRARVISKLEVRCKELEEREQMLINYINSKKETIPQFKTLKEVEEWLDTL